jgi:hypothetical protein
MYQRLLHVFSTVAPKTIHYSHLETAHSAHRPSFGLLYQHRMMMNVEQPLELMVEGTEVLGEKPAPVPL